MLRPRHLIECLYIALALLAIIQGSASAESMVVTTVDSNTVTGTVTAWTDDRIELAVEDTPVAFVPNQILNVRASESAAINKLSLPYLELLDGSLLPINSFTVRNRLAELTTPLTDQPLNMAVDRIRVVQFQATGDAPLFSREETGDSIAVLNKEATNSEVLTGVVGDVTAEVAEFTWEGDTIPVKRSKIAAIAFFQGEQTDMSPPVCDITFASGARLAAKQINQSNRNLEITTVGGLKVSLPVADVVTADYSVGKLTYLSDMEPLRSKWTPLVEMPAAAESIKNFGTPRRNISFTGSPLTLSWPAKEGPFKSTLKTYDKGLALRSRTELEFRLPRNRRRFVATAGIDPETLLQGNVLLRIETDGQMVFERAIQGKLPPIEIDLDIANKQKLKIIVDYGENLDLGDRLHLVEARLVK